MQDVNLNRPSLLCCNPNLECDDVILQLEVLLVVYCYFAEVVIRLELFYLGAQLGVTNLGFLIKKVYLNYYYFS